MQATKNYIEALKRIDFSQASETSLRTAFENYINEFIEEAKLPAFKILQEGKRIGNFGVPDFRISFNDSMIGYIETKKTDENLDKILKSEQIKKYRELSQNLIVTNYLEFVWIKVSNNVEIIKHETLCYLSDIQNKKFKLDTGKESKTEELLKNFFSQTPKGISTPKDLALALAVRCKNLKDFINEELKRQNEQSEQDILYELYKAFKINIFAELNISEFSDAFSQMISFGLYLAGLNADTKLISIKNAQDFIPSNFQLIKELYKFFEVLEKSEYKETKWIIDETISIINNIEWFTLKQNMSFNKKVKDNENIETDAYIYFYETFLATYDYNLRKSKGVYYTPPQVVNFIVRAIDEILINTFKLSNGLADRNKVTVLDFATGTGTFLLEVFKIILDKINLQGFENHEGLSEKSKMIIQDHILKNLYGFEYLIAPYTIAHLKLSQFLKENGYEFQDKDRLQVYLTNTLEPVDKQLRVPFMPQLTKETREAQEIKDKSILVITGNPPYSYVSKNNGEWISNSIKEYYKVDDTSLNERNPKGLQDDYVKFIRFAQDKMDKVEQGIVGIITNHSFLDNPTFRGMRQSLMNTFDQLYFIDLHGNAKKKEKTPEGKKDENVFDIQQGVCISILLKKKGLKKGIFHTNFWGDRNTKLDLCLNNSINSLEFNELKPNSPFYLFVPQNQDVRTIYEKFWSIKDIFEVNSVGIVTANDNLTIAYDKKELEKRFNKIKNSEFHQIKQDYVLSDNYFESRKDFFLKIKEKQLNIREINYRPFDKRFVWWDTDLIERSRENIMKHFVRENVAILTVRSCQGARVWNHSFITCGYTDMHVIPIGTYILPLYRYNGNGNGGDVNYLFKEDDKKDNFTEAFRKFIKTKYKAKPVDKKEITEIEKQIKNLDKECKKIEKQIFDFEKQKFPIETINAIKQLAEELKTQIEQKQQELKVANISQNADYEPSPDEIFYYIYAVLHSPTFREKYPEFLKMDFPRIPFIADLTGFKNLSGIGKELANAHLLKNKFQTQEYSHLGKLKGEGDNIVIKPNFRTEKTENEIRYKLYINKKQYFETVPVNVFNFQIGGYQVLDKYIKDRKNRTLTHDEIDNIENIVKVLTFTIKQKELIDKETKEWI